MEQVTDPRGVVAVDSLKKSMGKAPGHLTPSGWVAHAIGSSQCSSLQVASEWDKQRSNVGLVLGRPKGHTQILGLRAIDFDCNHPIVAEFIKAGLQALYGDKIGFRCVADPNWHRFAVVLQVTDRMGKPIGGKTFSLQFTDPNGTAGKVEILADGRMIVVGGVHSVTKTPIMWTGRSPFIDGIAAFLVVTEAEFQKLVEAIKAMLVEVGCTNVGLPHKRTALPHAGPAAAGVRSGGDVCPGGEAELRAYVSLVPNGESFASYDDWIPLMAALYGASGGADWGFAIALEWCGQRPQSAGEPKKTWNSFQGTGTDLGFAFIQKCARRNNPGAAAVLAFRSHPIDQAEIDALAARVGPAIIQVRGGSLAENASEAATELVLRHVPFYAHGRRLVEPVAVEVPAADGGKTRAIVLADVTATRMRDVLAQIIVFQKYDRRSDTWVRIDPPKDVAQTVVEARIGVFPSLAGVIRAPTLRPDGTLLSFAGYDPRTRLLLVGPAPVVAVADSPTEAQARAALQCLHELLAEFPFVDDASRSVALSALITAVIRPMLPVVPLHAFVSPMPGTGKSYLADLISATSTGARCPVLAASYKEEETEKRLAAALLKGTSIICIDNLNGNLGGDLLCQSIDRRMLDIRPLGTSVIRTVENDFTLLANGNNMRIVGDMTRRTLVSTLNAKLEHPEHRVFKQDPIAAVMRDCGRYISACLTIVKAYLAAGRPGKLPALASFEAWSDTVRSALVWLGRDDPCQTQEAARASDPERELFIQVATAWHANFASTPTSVAVACANAVGSLRDALLAVAADRAGRHIDRTRLGNWLRRNKDRRIGGFHLKGIAASSKHVGNDWTFEWLGAGAPPAPAVAVAASSFPPLVGAPGSPLSDDATQVSALGGGQGSQGRQSPLSPDEIVRCHFREGE
jgi:putative DNA primase/helicase